LMLNGDRNTVLLQYRATMLNRLTLHGLLYLGLDFITD